MKARSRPTTPSELWRRYSAPVLAILFALCVTVAILTFRDQLEALAGYGYLGVFVISILGNATIIFPVPSLAVVFAGGSVLNPLFVGLDYRSIFPSPPVCQYQYQLFAVS